MKSLLETRKSPAERTDRGENSFKKLAVLLIRVRRLSFRAGSDNRLDGPFPMAPKEKGVALCVRSYLHPHGRHPKIAPSRFLPDLRRSLMEGTTLTVAARAAQFSPPEFADWLDERRDAVNTLLETVKEQVATNNIEPIVGARIASCIAGSVYGYEEFHPRGMTPPAEQLLEALNPQVALAGANRGQ